MKIEFAPGVIVTPKYDKVYPERSKSIRDREGLIVKTETPILTVVAVRWKAEISNYVLTFKEKPNRFRFFQYDSGYFSIVEKCPEVIQEFATR